MGILGGRRGRHYFGFEGFASAPVGGKPTSLSAQPFRFGNSFEFRAEGGGGKISELFFEKNWGEAPRGRGGAGRPGAESAGVLVGLACQRGDAGAGGARRFDLVDGVFSW